MAFILSAQRDEDCGAAFKNYEQYLAEKRDLFPPGARRLINSDWYFTFFNQAPHDAWLESIAISESPSIVGEAQRSVSITIRLLAACHDGHIEFHYPRVVRYSLESGNNSPNHGDWRYDEFRLSDDGYLIHEIEWWNRGPGTWLIESDDVEYRWVPSNTGITSA